MNKYLTPCPSPKARGERKEGGEREERKGNSEKGKVNKDEEIFKRN